MSADLTKLAWAIRHPRARQIDPSRHPITRTERRWFRSQAAHVGAFGNPEACRIATLHVFDLDVKADAGLGRTGVTRG